MNWYRTITSGAEDEKNRQLATSIADRIISFINSSQNLYGNGLPVTKTVVPEFDLSEIISEFPLRLRFLNQPGFGRNTDMGSHLGNVISIALPSRTKAESVLSVYDKGQIVWTEEELDRM